MCPGDRKRLNEINYSQTSTPLFFFLLDVTLTACDIVKFRSVFTWCKGPLSESFCIDKGRQRVLGGKALVRFGVLLDPE